MTVVLTGSCVDLKPSGPGTGIAFESETKGIGPFCSCGVGASQHDLSSLGMKLSATTERKGAARVDEMTIQVKDLTVRPWRILHPKEPTGLGATRFEMKLSAAHQLAGQNAALATTAIGPSNQRKGHSKCPPQP